MEMMRIQRYDLLRGICLCICILLMNLTSAGQPPVGKYHVRDGKMVIELPKKITPKELESFILVFDLADLDLKTFLASNKADSLQKLGWMIETNTNELLVISKPLFSFDLLGSPSDRIRMAEKIPLPKDLLPLRNSFARYGVNKFRRNPFRATDSTVTYFLRDHLQAKKVSLAGSFTNWEQQATPMQPTDSGWVLTLKQAAGKHWYKFIVDGKWITDPDNQLQENDGRGNVNSVYYKTNALFVLEGYPKARKVYVSGSFNNWKEKELQMTRTESGWQLPVMLQEGTHTYKFIVDGTWMPDSRNMARLPDGHGGYNSVLQFGQPFTFRLPGFAQARQVVLSGTFNGWKEDELFLVKGQDGWELPYTIGPGNYEYKFIVDGKWMPDPGNPYRGEGDNSFMVIAPNYTFRLKAPEAAKVYLAGDLNGWNPNSLLMKKEGDTWVFHVHLPPGKHRYKFVVDGKWILDPANKLWEQNEYHTGNSIVWIGQ